jgi:hypothetical protein
VGSPVAPPKDQFVIEGNPPVSPGSIGKGIIGDPSLATFDLAAMKKSHAEAVVPNSGFGPSMIEPRSASDETFRMGPQTQGVSEPARISLETHVGPVKAKVNPSTRGGTIKLSMRM